MMLEGVGFGRDGRVEGDRRAVALMGWGEGKGGGTIPADGVRGVLLERLGFLDVWRARLIVVGSTFLDAMLELLDNVLYGPNAKREDATISSCRAGRELEGKKPTDHRTRQRLEILSLPHRIQPVREHSPQLSIRLPILLEEVEQPE
jgi:hypothetical protein